MSWFPGGQEPGREPQWEVPAEEAARVLSAANAPMLLDVREPDEWTGPLGHVAGARLVPLGRLLAGAREIAESAGGGPVVTVCRSGARSLIAAAILRRAGVRQVRSMEGGMLQWNALGLPVAR